MTLFPGRHQKYVTWTSLGRPFSTSWFKSGDILGQIWLVLVWPQSRRHGSWPCLLGYFEQWLPSFSSTSDQQLPMSPTWPSIDAELVLSPGMTCAGHEIPCLFLYCCVYIFKTVKMSTQKCIMVLFTHWQHNGTLGKLSVNGFGLICNPFRTPHLMIPQVYIDYSHTVNTCLAKIEDLQAQDSSWCDTFWYCRSFPFPRKAWLVKCF